MASRVLIGGNDLGPSCPDFTFAKVSPLGDQSASITIPFTQGMRLPRGDTDFVIEDDVLGPIWTGFTGPLDPPDLSVCSGSVTISALGWGQSMVYKRREAETVYGPRWDATILGSDVDGGQTVEAAVINAVSQGAPNVMLIDSNVARTGVTLQETENFVGQGAADIVSNMMARTQHLATPAIWHVRQGVFFWKAMDLAPRYQVFMAGGVKVKPKFDPTKQFSRVMVGWGKSTEQVVLWPDTIVYDTRKQIVDLYINAGAEIRDEATALALAQGIYARMRLLSPEWSLDISIPSSCAVEELVDGAWVEINPITVEPGYMLRIPDLDQGAFGPDLTIPQGGFLTRVSWQNKTALMGLSVGEPRGPGSFSRLARRVQAAGVTPLNIWGYLGRDVSTPRRDAAQTGLLGPQLISSPPPNKPPPVDYQIPAVSTKDKTLMPGDLPPIPPTFGFQINTADSIGKKGVTSIEPQVLEKYSLNASKPCTVTIKVTRVSDGATVIAAASLSAEQRKLETLILPQFTITKPDHLEYEVTVADSSMESPDADSGADNYVTIDFRARRYYPEYPGDTAPKTGKQF